MLGTIAFVTIFAAILVFFVDEFTAYAKALVAKPYVFLVYGLLLSSALIEIHTNFLLWLVISVWIDLLLVVQWLSQHALGYLGQQFLAKMVVVITVSTCPVLVAWVVNVRAKKRSVIIRDTYKKRGYVTGLVVWLITVFLLVLGPPGSDFSG